MDEHTKEQKKKLTIDLWIIALVTMAIYIVYGFFGSGIMSFCKNSDISVPPTSYLHLPASPLAL